jgi:ataxia telangiectasia mutated family protein
MSSSRVNAAYRVVHSLRQKLPVVTETMERTLRAYIQLAKASTADIVSERQKQRLANKNISYREVPLAPLPSADPAGSQAAAELKFFHELLEQLPAQPMLLTQALSLPRQPHAIARNADDAPLIRIVKIEPTFDLTDTGISRPKIIKLHASDGRVYRQLVKGGDDMRQDAVMQQVFATMNFTLRAHVSTRARDLHIRTYRVMPTSPQTGIIEWVENTEAFGGVINGDTMTGGSGVGSNQGLHQRYFPHDFTHRECRAQLESAADKEDAFALICQQFQPSFRFFFTENFHDPQSWYHARLRYIRSVAANSMAGYILGVGDRHAQNILIDKGTGEVVHIDFGIVFEQGKLLTIPELVPFRLTRDVVDGMGGGSGTDGTFRRCCEEVLHVLRQHARNLLTILEVVIHDPLYRWSLSPVQARTKQGGDNTEVAAAAAAMAAAGRQRRQQAAVASAGDPNDGTTRGSSGKDAAEKTLMRIRQKLQGYEDPTGEALKVEAHVDFLINEARSPAHLSRIFVGWAPWL